MRFNLENTEDKIIILSAHCDDIPLSLGGCLSGKLFTLRPNVIVVFSTTNYIADKEGPISEEEVTRIRIEEEENAAKLANYNVNFLGFKDAICRPNYSNYASLFQEEPVFKEPIYPLITKELNKLLINHKGLICSPLSIGNHIDHRILYHYTIELINENPNIPLLFYEDLPYADQLGNIKQDEIINNIKKIIYINPYIFRNFEIGKKLDLLKIYKSQMDKEHLEMVIHYWNSIGKGERIWLTKSANKYLRNYNIYMS